MVKSVIRLPNYIYTCLYQYGNTIIHEKYIKQYGEQAIIEHLKLYNFDCVIHKKTWLKEFDDSRKEPDIDYIIERKRR